MRKITKIEELRNVGAGCTTQEWLDHNKGYKLVADDGVKYGYYYSGGSVSYGYYHNITVTSTTNYLNDPKSFSGVNVYPISYSAYGN